MRLDSVALLKQKLRKPKPKRSSLKQFYFNLDRFLKQQHIRDIRQRK